jgi:uncharacterized protein (TIGR03790 family)
MRPTRRLVFGAAIVIALFRPTAALAQSTDNLLLVVNDASPASVQIGEYYAHARSVPESRIVHITTVTSETIERLEYLRTIEAPIAVALGKANLEDVVLYIVLTKGVPLRIAGTEGLDGTVASVDSELALLYRRLTGAAAPLGGRINNPYFLADRPLTDAKPFTHVGFDIYLVTRLDGFTVDDVLKLIDRAQTPSRDGKIVLDARGMLSASGGDDWLRQAADRLHAIDADRTLFESTRALASTTSPVLGYYSWGSNDPSNHLRRFGFHFVNGAIGGLFVSTDGRTFAEPPPDWTPSDPNGGPKFGGTWQTLAGDLIRDGITGIAAHVAEPYLDATIRPQVLFPAYLAGFNLAESFYLAMPFLSWQTIVIGDPLCTPFPRQPVPTVQLAPKDDPDTMLPALFSNRRLAAITIPGTKPEAMKWTLRAESAYAHGDKAEGEASLAKAVAVDNRLTNANLALASVYEERNEYDKAIARYREVIAVDPQNVIALNNLAYALAERKHQPKDALPFAERAYRIASGPALADTLGWIHHLLGEDQVAAPLIEQAAGSPHVSADMLVHAALVHGAVNDLEKAKTELDAAAKLDPTIEDRDEVKALRAKIKGTL